jgi:hypothetical protein
MKMLASLFVLLPVAAWAQAPFDGTWVTRPDTIKISGKPEVYLVQDGIFTCDACVPELQIKADGSEQKVTGHAYYDTAAVRVIDAQSIEFITHAAGKLANKQTLTVSADGKTMKDEFVDYTGTSPAGGTRAYSRVAAGPAGAHALSGSWRTNGEGSEFSSDLLTVIYKETPNGLTMSTPTGQSYDAKFDGKEYLTAGDPGKTMVSLKRIDAHTIQETDSRQGKVTDVIRFKLSDDGRVIHAVDEDKARGTTMSFMMGKKPT